MNNKRSASISGIINTKQFTCAPLSIVDKIFETDGISNIYSFYLYILRHTTYSEYTTYDGINLNVNEFIIRPNEMRNNYDVSLSRLRTYRETLKKEEIIEEVRKEGKCIVYQLKIKPNDSKPRKKRATSETKAEKSLRDELFDLYTDNRCKVFYRDYHESLEIPEEGYSLVHKEWQKMTSEEREQAIHYIPQYARANRKRDIKTKAVNYLKRGFALEHQLAKNEVPENIFKLWMKEYTERQMERKEQKDNPDRQKAIEYLDRYAKTVEELTK